MSTPPEADPEVVLLAATGLSPAIVTETIWALAHEHPPVIPHRVVLVTTSVGVTKLEDQLLSPLAPWGGMTVWSALRQALGVADDRLILETPRVIDCAHPASGRVGPLEDIVSPADNEAAADFILEEVRRVTSSERRLIASVAGGRKTMGALLHAAITLLGREDDRITHVLVDPPYETLPGFWFPGQPGGPVTDRGGKSHDPSMARLHLADVPFVPLSLRLRELAPKGRPGASFRALVSRYRAAVARDDTHAPPAELTLRVSPRELVIEGSTIPITGDQRFGVIRCLLEANAAGVGPGDLVQAAALVRLWHGKLLQDDVAHLSQDQQQWLRRRADTLDHRRVPKWAAECTDDGVKRAWSSLRTRLRTLATTWQLPARGYRIEGEFTLSVED